MSIYINGMPANTPEEKKKAIESIGGTYNEVISGDVIQGSFDIGDAITGISFGDIENKTPGTGNYTENLGGRFESKIESQSDNSIHWEEVGRNRFKGTIEVNELEYEVKSIYDDETEFVVYIPGITELGDGEVFDSLSDFAIVEWCVQTIQEKAIG